MTFGAPLWGFALLAIVAAAIALARRDARARATLPGATGRLREGGVRDRATWRRVCEGFGGTLLIAALALPRCDSAGGAAPKPALLLVDVSRSMLAEDADGSRFERARRGAGEALAALAGRRVGLVTFAGASEEIAPPTADLAALRALLDEVDPRRTLEPGSEPAPALERALQRLPEGGDVLLFSDGEWDDAADRERTLAAAARQARVAIHVVPLGGAAPVPLIVRERDGSTRPLVDGEGRTTVTRADRSRMAALAEAGGGRTIELGDDGRAFAFFSARAELRDAALATAGASPWSAALALALALLIVAHVLREKTT